MSGYVFGDLTNKKRERLEKEQSTDKARLKYMREVDRCPVCRHEVRTRAIKETSFQTDVEVEFSCGATFEIFNHTIRVKAACPQPFRDAAVKIDQGFASKHKAVCGSGHVGKRLRTQTI